MDQLAKAERDSIVLLGLLSIAHVQFDFQFQHPDGGVTHSGGLNIFAVILDNRDGELLGQKRNQIHSFENPMLHAEQLTLAEAIESIRIKRPRNRSKVSVESYYRKFMFNDPVANDYWTVGSTIYTTLEPCPFCAAALLVNRMKRIVFLVPDKKFGSAYAKLKSEYYSEYDMLYEQLTIPTLESSLVNAARGIYIALLERVDQVKKENPSLYDTLLLDLMSDILSNAYAIFKSLDDSAVLSGSKQNLNTLMEFKKRLF